MKRSVAWNGVSRLGGVLLLLAGGACSSAPPAAKEPAACKLQMVTAAIISSPHINPSPEGEPRPVQVRLYQLKTDVRFVNASFEEVWKKDADTLKDDLVKVDELPIYPNTRTQAKFERDPSAQFLVAAALFRTPKGKSWFVSFEFPPPPDAGACGVPDCPNGKCDGGAGPVNNPKFYLWLDDTRIEDGIEHANDFPDGRVTTVPLPGKAPAAPASAPAPAPAAPPPATGAEAPK